MRKAVAIFLVNSHGEILMQLRDNKTEISYPGYWSLFGGHIEEDENIVDAAKREVFEEIGENINNLEFLQKVYISKYDEEVYFLKARINQKIEEIEITEGQEAKYFAGKDLETLKIPEPVKNTFLKYRGKILA